VHPWLCDLAIVLAARARFELTWSHQSGGRFNTTEEIISGLLARETYLNALRWGMGARVWVREISRANETVEGGDIELWFLDGAGGGFGWRIQAKRLFPGGPATPPRFRYLDHVVDGSPQVDVLADSCADVPNLKPVYWLYGFDPHEVMCQPTDACRCGTRSDAQGILVAGAHTVRDVLANSPEPKSFHTWGGAIGAKGRSLANYWCSGPVDILGAFEFIRAQSRRFDPDDEPPDTGALPPYVEVMLQADQADVDRRIARDLDTVPAASIVTLDLGSQ
jgi:hypothetical protein